MSTKGVSRSSSVNHAAQFLFLGNQLVLDLVNTEIVSRGEGIDPLRSDADLAATGLRRIRP